MEQIDRFTVANHARIPCTVRTLKPFWIADSLKPWVHFGEIADAILYLAVRTGFPEDETLALKEQLERLSSSLNALSDSQEVPLDVITNINEQ